MSFSQVLKRFFVSLLVFRFSFFKSQGTDTCYVTCFVILLRSYFCGSCWLNSSREARAGNSSIGMQMKYLSASWMRRGGDKSLKRAGLSKQIQGSVKRKGRVRRKGTGKCG